MVKKKIIAALLVGAVLVTGGGVAAIATRNMTTFAENANEVIGKTVSWNAGEESIYINEVTSVPVKSTARSFELLGDIQKIDRVAIFGVDGAAVTNIKYQAGYKGTDKILYTDIITKTEPGNAIDFTGSYPCRIKLTVDSVDIKSIDIRYNCINLNDKNYDAYPVEKKFYVVGKGSFINPNRPVEWSPIGGAVVCDEYWDSNVEKSNILSFKAGDVFKVTNFNTDVWFWTMTDDSNAFKGDNPCVKGGYGSNVEVLRDCKLKIRLKSNDGGNKNIWIDEVVE